MGMKKIKSTMNTTSYQSFYDFDEDQERSMVSMDRESFCSTLRALNKSKETKANKTKTMLFVIVARFLRVTHFWTLANDS